MLETLRSISALPDVLGKHACEECGHPEMRYLPDGVFHCPACGSEVVPIDARTTPSKPDEHGEAYQAGWVDGRFGERDGFVDNLNLAQWEAPSDRLDYYRGHRAGSEAHKAAVSSRGTKFPKRPRGRGGESEGLEESRAPRHTQGQEGEDRLRFPVPN